MIVRIGTRASYSWSALHRTASHSQTLHTRHLSAASVRFLSSYRTVTLSECLPASSAWNTDSSWNTSPLYYTLAAFGAAAACATTEYARCEIQPQTQVPAHEAPELHELVNWSGTHTVHTERYYQPESLEELKEVVKQAHNTRQKLRPIGSALSPNGLGFQEGGMVSLVMMDNIIAVDHERKQVRLQAGARVSQVVEALREHGLTLQNYASITEQQIGGFIQVGAHGTGATLPPVDEQVIAIKMVTPAAGELDLSIDDDDPSLFQLARTSLGLFGIVAEVTLQCVPAHKLVEKTFVISRDQVAQLHPDLMRDNRHLRYHWIPFTDSVVVVTCNPVEEDAAKEGATGDGARPMEDRLFEARSLLRGHKDCPLSEAQINELSFTALRNELLSLDPLNVGWIKKVNRAELAFWKLSEGTRVDWSDRILQFDCGGQQWVSEVVFPVPQNDTKKTDVVFVEELLELIERESIPAHAPIEQRWTAPSVSPMSPAGEKPHKELGETYSWVGIIMYMPDSSTGMETRRAITEAFHSYKEVCENVLWEKFKAVEHWAKIEMPKSDDARILLQTRTMEKYPVVGFLQVCNIFDPHGILRNDLMDTILSRPVTESPKEDGAER